METLTKVWTWVKENQLVVLGVVCAVAVLVAVANC